jgi:hypothetical protein
LFDVVTVKKDKEKLIISRKTPRTMLWGIKGVKRSTESNHLTKEVLKYGF